MRNAHINLIHACSVDLQSEEDYNFIRDYGIGLVWSPVSNLMLYEDTPAYYEYLGDDDLLVGIGSDWLPSGSKTVWDECKAAFDLIQKVSEESDRTAEDLLKACTYTAGRMIGNPRIGNIKEGCFADLFILRGKEPVDGELERALQTFFETDDGGVEAVLAGGQCVYGDDAFLEELTGGDLSSFGKYETEHEALQGKSFLLPEIFEGSTFDEVYDAYTALLNDVGIEMSGVRRLEDPVYIDGIARVLSQE